MLRRTIVGLTRQSEIFARCKFQQFSTLANELPQNLHLDDVQILKSPAPKVVVDPMRFLFPTLDTPKSISILKFRSPGNKESVDAPIEQRVFSVALRKDIVHEVIRHQRHAQRQPKKTKRIPEIRGSSKKPRRQKGGGQSQVGNRRNSAWRGGQKAHGPVLRDYSISLNRKVLAMGMMISLAAKLKEGNLIVFDELSCETHKTKELSTLLEQHSLHESSVLFIDNELNMNFLTASGNIPLVKAVHHLDATVYDVIKREKLVLTAAALDTLQTRLLAQYTHRGKMRAVANSLANYNALVQKHSAEAK